MSLKRYLVHLSVLGLSCLAVAFAHPFASTVHEGGNHRDVQAESRLAAGVDLVQQRTVQLDAEMREAKRGNRAHRAETLVTASAAPFDPRWLDLDVEAEMRLLQDEHVRFLATLASSEAPAAGECLETP